MEFSSRVLIVPGLDNSGPQHWQTWWERRFPEFKRVQQRDWNRPDVKDWVETLDNEIMASSFEKVVIAAHSLGCCTVANWALQYKKSIKGALLVAPSDTESNNYPPGTIGFTPMPLQRLPFPTIVVMSTNDPFVSIDRAKAFAAAWGSELINIGNAGHVNSESNLGFWEFGLELLSRLDRS